MSFRGLLALTLLLAATGAERLAHYGIRSFLVLELTRGEGMTSAAITTTLSVSSFGSVVAMFVGAGLVLATGPRVTAVVGALLAALGLLLVALGAPLLAGWALAAAGAGIFRVCPFVAAAEVLGTDETASDLRVHAPHPQRFVRVAAFSAVAHAAINVCAAFAAPIAGKLYMEGGRAIAAGFAASLAFVAALFASGTAIVGMTRAPDRGAGPRFADPYRAPSPPIPIRPSAPSMKPLAGAALLACVVGAFDVGQATGAAHPPEMAMENVGRLYTINAAVTMIQLAIAAGALLIGAILGWAKGPLPLFGAGLAVASLGFFVRAFSGGQFVLDVAGMGLTAFGDMAMPIGLAYVALAVRGRASGLVVAGWFAVPTIASLIGSPLGYSSLRTPLLVLVGLVCLAAGGATAAFGRTLHRTWFDPPA